MPEAASLSFGLRSATTSHQSSHSPNCNWESQRIAAPIRVDILPNLRTPLRSSSSYLLSPHQRHQRDHACSFRSSPSLRHHGDCTSRVWPRRQLRSTVAHRFQMFGVTGGGMAAFRKWQNEGYRPRYSLDQWDNVGYGLPRTCYNVANQSIAK
jgi:hypothetical protein